MSDSFFFFLHKPVGFSSQQALTRARKKFNLKKIGHHGTLDPFAEGLLLVGVNEATKFFQFVPDEEKTYAATLILGTQTDTLDRTGTVTRNLPVPLLSASDIETTLKKFIGPQMQTPPAYSAVKVDGVASYERARRQEAVPLPPRPIEIHKLRLLSWESPWLTFEATVSRGTYVRVLASDVAEALGTCGHLTSLTRTRLNDRDDRFAVRLEQDEISDSQKTDIVEILTNSEKVELNQEQTKSIRLGQRVSWHGLPTQFPLICLLFQGVFLGMGNYDNGVISPVRLMSN